MEVRQPDGGMLGMHPELARRFLFQGARSQTVPPRTPRPVPLDRKVRVLAVVHGWMPSLAAGSERMLQHMLDALPEDEFETEILSFGVGEDVQTDRTYTYDGRLVHRGFSVHTDFEPDVIVFHHGYAARVLPALYAEYPHAWVIAVYHNERYDIEDIRRAGADLSVYNTRWVREALRGHGLVIHPPLEADRHRVESTGDAVTLINLQENKGIRLFERLADRMSDEHPFLGVHGTHGEQETWCLELTPGVTLMPTTQDMREVWSKTKVLLMPSEYESYGMVAAEASLNGIPVIANPTPGLVECLGGSGLFIPRDDTDAWERTLKLLLTDPEHYRVRSELAAVRGRELEAQSRRELSRFVRRVRRMVRP